MKKHASGGQGMIPWTPGCEYPLPSFLGVRVFAKAFIKNNQDLFVKLFKSLAPGRAAGGIFNLSASGGESGEATVANAPGPRSSGRSHSVSATVGSPPPGPGLCECASGIVFSQLLKKTQGLFQGKGMGGNPLKSCLF